MVNINWELSIWRIAHCLLNCCFLWSKLTSLALQRLYIKFQRTSQGKTKKKKKKNHLDDGSFLGELINQLTHISRHVHHATFGTNVLCVVLICHNLLQLLTQRQLIARSNYIYFFLQPVITSHHQQAHARVAYLMLNAIAEL